MGFCTVSLLGTRKGTEGTGDSGTVLERESSVLVLGLVLGWCSAQRVPKLLYRTPYLVSMEYGECSYIIRGTSTGRSASSTP